jgi:hypothetical protein
MNTTTKQFHSGSLSRLSGALVTMLLAAGAVAPAAEGVVSEELAVIQAMAAIVNDDAGQTYDYLYFESDFPASPHVASSMSNPDRTQFCGLSRDAAQSLVDELTAVTTKRVEFDASLAKMAGLKIGHKKLPRFKYLTLSRVVFAPSNQQAWLAVDLNGETGAIVRLDKVGGRWNKAARCGGWVKLAE